MPKKPKAFVLAGPTASGKTALALSIAKKLNCEIVCMDSMQIYRGMDIGTAKPTREERAIVSHHMLDVVAPWESYSVAEYQAQTERVMLEIVSRGCTPLLVGGTGLYLRALRKPMAMGGTGSDAALRKQLEAQARAPGGEETLHRALEAVDPDTASRLSLHDVRRVIRALEVYQVTGIPFSAQRNPSREPPFDYRVAALTIDREILYQRVNLRVEQMLERGLLDEIKSLLDSGVPPQAQAMQAIGYKELIPVCLEGVPLQQAVDAIQQGTRRYAKRQLTWLRREEPLAWVNALAPDAAEKLLDFYQKEGET